MTLNYTHLICTDSVNTWPAGLALIDVDVAELAGVGLRAGARDAALLLPAAAAVQAGAARASQSRRVLRQRSARGQRRVTWEIHNVLKGCIITIQGL